MFVIVTKAYFAIINKICISIGIEKTWTAKVFVIIGVYYRVLLVSTVVVSYNFHAKCLASRAYCDLPSSVNSTNSLLVWICTMVTGTIKTLQNSNTVIFLTLGTSVDLFTCINIGFMSNTRTLSYLIINI